MAISLLHEGTEWLRTDKGANPGRFLHCGKFLRHQLTRSKGLALLTPVKGGHSLYHWDLTPIGWGPTSPFRAHPQCRTRAPSSGLHLLKVMWTTNGDFLGTWTSTCALSGTFTSDYGEHLKTPNAKATVNGKRWKMGRHGILSPDCYTSKACHLASYAGALGLSHVADSINCGPLSHLFHWARAASRQAWIKATHPGDGTQRRSWAPTCRLCTQTLRRSETKADQYRACC